MLTVAQKYKMMETNPGTAYFPFINSNQAYIQVSTRHGNILVKWGDGVEQQLTTSKNVDATVTAPDIFTHTYSPNYTGDVQVVFKLGLGDVYSINFEWGRISTGEYRSFNIQDIKTFFAQFPNLYSVNFDIYSYQSYTTVIKGDFSQLPNSVERVKFASWEVKNNGVDQWLNISNYSPDSKLKYYNFSKESYGSFNWVTLKVNGDLSKIPSSCSFFKIASGGTYAGSSITYTAGKVWASSFDTLSIPLPLSHTELDNLLIDMDNSITTKIGDGVIALGGFRSATSDAAVASLQAKGFTVNINRVLNNVSNADSAILRLDFQNNFDVYSNSGMNIIAGDSSNQPTFALSGRKPGEYCAVFNGSQSIKTTTNLPVNSDKVTVAFWMKTTQTAASIVAELSPNTNTNNAFSAYLNDKVANSIQFNSLNTGANQSARTGANNGTWKHFVAVIDRSQNGANEILIYENGTLATFTKPVSTDNNGNFVNNILFIGQRAGSSAGFNGSLTKLKIYNYPLTAGEVSTLYNSEL